MFKLQSDEKNQLLYTVLVLSAISTIILASYMIKTYYQGPISTHQYSIEVKYSSGELDTLDIQYDAHQIDTLILDDSCIRTKSDEQKVCGVRYFKIFKYKFN